MLRNWLKTAWEKVCKLREAHGGSALVFVGLISVGALGFETGFAEGQKRVSEPILIEVPAIVDTSLVQMPGEESKGDASVQIPESTGSLAEKAQEALIKDRADQEKCAFVGSKNSDKYHLPSCSFAKRIKPENRVCFASTQEAEARGYKPGCLK